MKISNTKNLRIVSLNPKYFFLKVSVHVMWLVPFQICTLQDIHYNKTESNVLCEDPIKNSEIFQGQKPPNNWFGSYKSSWKGSIIPILLLFHGTSQAQFQFLGNFYSYSSLYLHQFHTLPLSLLQFHLSLSILFLPRVFLHI